MTRGGGRRQKFLGFVQTYRSSDREGGGSRRPLTGIHFSMVGLPPVRAAAVLVVGAMVVLIVRARFGGVSRIEGT
jgi:hypothetical protein